MCRFSDKTDNFDFFGANLLNMDFWLEIQKTNVEIRISFLEIPCVSIDNFVFLNLNLPKNGFWSWNFKNLRSGFGISTSKILCEPFLSQNEERWIFRSKFGEIAQLRILWFEYFLGCCRELGRG